MLANIKNSGIFSQRGGDAFMKRKLRTLAQTRGGSTDMAWCVIGVSRVIGQDSEVSEKCARVDALVVARSQR